jgi:gluconolactonase
MIFADELGNPEGPVLLPDGSWALVEMRPDRGCITHMSADGKKRRTIAKTGRPNGLAVDKDGVLWVAESTNPPSVIRLSMDGKMEVLAKDCDGQPFLFPNDLCFGPDGALYMTDSGYSCQEWMTFDLEQKRTTKTDGKVYRIQPKNRVVETLDSGLPFANGIVFGPDKGLYVAGTQSGMVYRYPWMDGKLGERQEFGSVRKEENTGILCGPDGMAFGRDGNLYVAVVRQSDVTVLNPDGNVVTRIPVLGELPTNVAFGPPGSKKIYVTNMASGHVETFDVETEGLPLYTG